MWMLHESNELLPHLAIGFFPLLEELSGGADTGRVTADAGEQQQIIPEHPLGHRPVIRPALTVNQRLE